MTTFKRAISALPIMGPLLKAAYRRSMPFDGSAAYWDKRYGAGGNSGVGSYGRLAEFKAAVLNAFVQQHDIQTVIELGCGDGAQLARADYPLYVGVDVSSQAIAACRMKFASDNLKSFYHTSARPQYAAQKYDLALSLDVIYHLIEDDVYERYMADLFGLASRYVIVYSSNYDRASRLHHIRHREFSRWILSNTLGWQLLETIENRYPFDRNDRPNTSTANFYIYERHPR